MAYIIQRRSSPTAACVKILRDLCAREGAGPSDVELEKNMHGVRNNLRKRKTKRKKNRKRRSTNLNNNERRKEKKRCTEEGNELRKTARSSTHHHGATSMLEAG
jgi:hypothetical protein